MTEKASKYVTWCIATLSVAAIIAVVVWFSIKMAEVPDAEVESDALETAHRN